MGMRWQPVGVWELVGYHEVGADGSEAPGPLGTEPRGMLVYTADGHMTVSMMRGPGDASAGETFMGYAGRWFLEGDRMTHRVAVSAHPHLVGTDQLREVRLDGQDLLLSGTALIGGRPRNRRLRWRRVTR
ncbi:lipocalin-like domain-containing protein [Streptomyces sp. NPDC001595]|uniref:lipocalin-like domain-containing protein n=1 Tax=Streptomyces sp. NPDC001532 TaxID=3154520 RepID=UPI0033346DAE